MVIAALTLAALLTAILSGVAGLGGGTVLIALFFAAGLAPAFAVALHAGVQLVANGSRAVAYAPHIAWAGLGWFLLAAVPAPFLVAPLVVNANPDWIRLILAAFIVMAAWPGWAKNLRLHGALGLVVAGAIAGGAGMLVGATGLLVAPFFLREDWPKERVIATLAVAQTGAHALKLAAFSAHGFSVVAHIDWLLPMALAVIAGSFIGRRLVGLFTEARFRMVFRGILAVLALKLAYDGVSGLLG